MYNTDQELSIGIIRHLTISSDTKNSKVVRLHSLSILQEVLEYVVLNPNKELDPSVVEIYARVLPSVLNKVITAKVKMHTEPTSFTDEIGFFRTVLGYNNLHM